MTLRKFYGVILGTAFLLLSLLAMSGAMNPARAEFIPQDSSGHGWWAALPNSKAAGPFPDGVSAAQYSFEAFWANSPLYHSPKKCYYFYSSIGLNKGRSTLATCEWNDPGVSAVNLLGHGALDCDTGEVHTLDQGGCAQSPGDIKKPVCMASAGNPVDLINGNKHQTANDLTSEGPWPFSLNRSYNSQQVYHATQTSLGRFGRGWRTDYDAAAIYRGASATTPTRIHVVLPDGREAVFRSVSGVMQPAYFRPSTASWLSPRTDVNESITLTGGNIWRYVGPDDTAYSFDLDGKLTEIRMRDGYTRSFTYNVDGKNTLITDNFGRTISFTYNAQGLVETATGPDGKITRYSYIERLATVPGVSLPPVPDHPNWALEKVTYPDSTPGDDSDNPSVTYHYEDANFPFALTGVTDERGVRFATWAYDAKGRAISSQHAGGAEAVSIAYDDVAKTRTVTNPLGKQAIYQLEIFQEKLRIKQIAGQPSANCVAADTVFAYDANGYISQETSGNGVITKYVRNARGLETSRTEAFGAPQARTITTGWHATFNLPVQIVAPDLITHFTYNADGLLTSRVETDATTHILPYSTNGETRAWGYSYLASGLLDTMDGPLPGPADTVDYDYDAQGYLSRITNEAGHVTLVNSVNGRGQPLSVTDPNGIVSALTYDARGWLTSVTVDPGAAQAVTSLTYDETGQITRITRPDGSFLDYSWDDARRLIRISNAANEKIIYTYDAMGNRTRTEARTPGDAITATQSQVFDELGRLLRELGAAGQITAHGYDKDDNRTSTLDPRGKLYGYAFDALNRLSSETDPLSAQIVYAKDAADNLVSVTDPRSLTTSYVHNGWGEVIRETSPDRGVTDYVRDTRGLMTQMTDARGVVSNYAYDALGRMLSRAFPAAPGENVTYAYDDVTAGNKGIGRLTRVTDRSGETAYSYDARGNLIQEARVIAGQSYTIQRAYDLSDNLISLTYPSGRIVNYSRDAVGRAVSVTTRLNAMAIPVTVADGATYAPFGPLTGFTFGNGIVLNRSYDQDYRLRTQTAGAVQSFTINYDASGNISSINDDLFSHDDVNRLISANGPVYGSYGYTYDLAGNRIGRSQGAMNESYTYAPGSNRLASVSGSAVRGFTYDAAGNAVNDDRGAAGNYAYAYDQSGNMS